MASPEKPTINVQVEPGTSEHTVNVENSPTVEERRKHPAPVNVAVGTGGLTGIWSIVGNLSAVTFVMVMFYFQSKTNNEIIRDQIETNREQMKSDREEYRNRDKGMLDRFDSMIMVQQTANMQQQATNNQIQAATKELQHANQSLKESVKYLSDIAKKDNK